MKFLRLATAAMIPAVALSASACSVLKPEESGLSADSNIVVSSSEAPAYEPKDTDDKKVTSDLGAPQKDEGLGVTWELQGVYPDSVQGSVVTILVRNDNDMPLPPDAIEAPTLERADGNGGWQKVEELPYDAQSNPDVAPPGLDKPLGSHAATNLQYRFDQVPGNLWNARLHIGNVTWVGDMNL